ncbi:hypothetical protein F5Y16DRAFT_406554 [Xylariaceae sp. FL0255]|nr:hypothetical protein F5Y16DRAFT_406554 [Xylariaceae sp. FL0255]
MADQNKTPVDIDSVSGKNTPVRDEDARSDKQSSGSESGEASPVREGARDQHSTTAATTQDSPVTTISDKKTTASASASAMASTTTAPPLPEGPPPAPEDDGWDYHWDETNQSYYFYNRFTHESTWENPRVKPAETSDTTAATTATTATTAATDPLDNTQLQTPPATAVPPLNERLPAGGYNPAIHGDYDPNAWYAQNLSSGSADDASSSDINNIDPAAASAAIASTYAAQGSFNRFTGRWQNADTHAPENHNDDAKSRRQMNSFFDVDAAANAHNGRSLKAERAGKKPSKAELKQFKEKRRAKKEERRRAWLLD